LIGTEALRTTAPDGYTLSIATNSTHAAALYLVKKQLYNQTEDFEHIGLFGLLGTVALVRAGSPYKTLAELVAYAKANPGQVFFGYADTSSQVAAELLKARAALPVEGVQYKGIGNALTDLMGGRIQFMFANYVTSSGQIRGGKVLPIAVTEAQRSPLWPAVPTVAETYPDYELHAFAGLVAPRGTPKEIVRKINEAMRRVLTDPAFKSQLIQLGMTPKPMTSDEYRTFLAKETAQWKEYVKTAKIEPQ
jgi:tripartite-type tricarboxylate transporter receptor subunit TctC